MLSSVADFLEIVLLSENPRPSITVEIPNLEEIVFGVCDPQDPYSNDIFDY